MSSQKYASPLQLKIFPSRMLFTCANLIHFGAIAFLLPASLPFGIVIIGTLLLSASLVIHWCRLFWQCPRVSLETVWPIFTDVVWDENDQWQLTTGRGQHYTAQLLSTTYVSAHLVAINLRLENQGWYRRYRSIVLLSDNIDPETFRRLRIRLRWYSFQIQDNWAELK